MTEQKSKYFTVMIMPETSAIEPRRMRVSRNLIIGGVVGAGLLMLSTIGAVAYAVYHRDTAAQNVALRTERAQLEADLDAFTARLEKVDATVKRLREFDTKLRALTMVSDPDRHLAIGPVGGEGSGTRAADDPEGEEESALRHDLFGGANARSAALVAQHLEAIDAAADATSSSLENLSSYLGDQQALLSATPSRSPTHGYVTSGYGMRVDPFTGLPQFHAGIDFSARMGAKVMATADGIVVTAGKKGAYGKVIELEHDTGLVTKYAHLSKINVKVGGQVRRGQIIGLVGNTGRSTGPHLHYEVRMRGVAQNPQRFLLE